MKSISKIFPQFSFSSLRMRTFFYALAFPLLSGFGAISSQAQGVNSGGTDFWVGFMPNYIGGRNVTQLFLASGTNNTVKVTVGSSTTTYTLGPNQGITADL